MNLVPLFSKGFIQILDQSEKSMAKSAGFVAVFASLKLFTLQYRLSYAALKSHGGNNEGSCNGAEAYLVNTDNDPSHSSSFLWECASVCRSRDRFCVVRAYRLPDHRTRTS